MRKTLITAALFAAAAPAAAQPAGWDFDEEAIERVDFDRTAEAVDRFVGVMLGLPVGGIAAAFDPLGRGGIYPHDSLGSLMERNDPDARQRIREDIRGAARTARVTGRAVARMMPVLQQSLSQLQAGLAEAIDSARSE